jgi:hypothetical protein
MYQHTVYQLLAYSVYPLVLPPSTHPLLTPPVWGLPYPPVLGVSPGASLPPVYYPYARARAWGI